MSLILRHLAAAAVAAALLTGCGDDDGVLSKGDYRAIDLDAMEELPRGPSAEAAMAALVGEEIAFEELNHGGQGTALRATQLDPDDPDVAGRRTVAVILPHADGHWTVGWAGEQVKCWDETDQWVMGPCEAP